MSRTLFVVRVLLLSIIVAISLVGAPALAQGGTVVRVEPETLSTQVNSNLNLAVKVDNITNLAAIELHLSFNPNVLEVVQITNGGFVAADFIAQNVFDNATGTIDYAIAQLNRSPAQGSGTLLNITFRAKANGTSLVALRSTQAAPSGLLLSDSNGLSIQASWVNGNITVGSPITPTLTVSIPDPIITTTFTPTATPTVTGSATGSTPPSITPTPTLTPVTTTVTPTPPGKTLGTHVVQFGESLYCIGRAYKVSPWAIAEANGIWWPYIIFPTQRLTIPNIFWTSIPTGPVCRAQFPATATHPPTITPVPKTITPTRTPTQTGVAPTTPPPTSCRVTYTVRYGDTLYRIALSYGTTYSELARINQISNPRLIYSGQKICIP